MGGEGPVPPTVPGGEATLAERESGVAAEWAVGDVLLDTHEVTAILGAGGMERVYKVHHRGWDVDLAVKSPLPAALARAGLGWLRPEGVRRELERAAR